MRRSSDRLLGMILLAVFLGNVGVWKLNAQVRINEFMAINDQTLTDEDGAYSDWIELYNGSEQTVDLEGWYLTDDSENPEKWPFPAYSLQAGEYLLIFASGKDRYIPDGELHTNFKLSGSGEYLAMVNSEGILVSAFDPFYPEQLADISFGYYQDSYVSFSQATPGAKNSDSGVSLPPPDFSVRHGLYNTDFSLEIHTELPSADIYYTTDGSPPRAGDGLVYQVPILIDTTLILRAVAVVDDTIHSEVTTCSYIFPDKVLHQSNDPQGYPSEWGPYTAISGTSIADYEMDPEQLANPEFAASVTEGLQSIPTLSLVTDKDLLFSHSTDPESGGIYIYTGPPLSRTEDGLGKGWERPASIEFFNAEGTESFQVDCGVRIQGGHSRRPEKSPKHSFRLVFRSEYGPTRLNYPLFQDADADSSFNSLVLRAGFGLSWIHHSQYERERSQYQRDIWIKDTQRAIGHPSSHSEYVHLYINGIYWGIYAPSERMDADFAASYLNGDPEEFDVIKDYQDVADGEIDSWNKLIETANSGLADQASYQKIQGNHSDGSVNPEYESLVDVVNLADYMLINFYGGNMDWDHHNWTAIRNRVNPGKGFKFFCWDSEHLFEYVNHNVIDENNDYCPSRVFQQLRLNESFRRLFADRVQLLCFNGGLLTPESAAERWNIRSAQVEPAIVTESARWGDYRRDVHPFQTVGPFDLYAYENYWLPQRDYILQDYFPARTGVLINQLRAAGLFPQINAPEFYINGETYPGVEVSKGDLLSMSSEEGIVYYTLNGRDPADWGEDEDTELNTLIAGETTKYVWIPDQDIGKQWNTDLTFDQSLWSICSGSPGGIGYEKESGYEDYISLNVEGEMHVDGSDSPNTSCYVRVPFTLEAGDLEEFKALLLNISYDDGFAAFLNGIRVAEANAPFELQWNSASTDTHEALTAETFDISGHLDLLRAGENLLAIHALNANISSSDFLLALSLRAGDQAGGELSEDAILYEGAIPLEESVHLMARTYVNGSWSAVHQTLIAFQEDYMDLKLTEIHYHPLTETGENGSDYEFVEIKNTGSSTLSLGNVRFIDGIDFTFSPGNSVEPGGFAVLASHEKSFIHRYGFRPSGEYSGNLNNGGERLIMESPYGDTLVDLVYDNNSPWPVLADGTGYSLVPQEFNPSGEQNDPQNWRSSYDMGGSPGRDDTESTEVNEKPVDLVDFHLGQNQPNPFSDLTYIHYVLPEDASVELSVYNMVGQKVAVLASGHKTRGSYRVSWNGVDDAGQLAEEGFYVYRLTVHNHGKHWSQSRKLIKY